MLQKINIKKIIINGRFLTQKMTGVQRYAYEVVSELDKIAGINNIEIAVPHNTNNIPKYENIKVVKIGKLTNRLWEQISFPYYIWKNRAISLNLCNTAPLLFPGIICIHDMKIKATPEFFGRKFVLWYRLIFYNATKRAKYIFTVSEFSKNEIMKYYKIANDRISISYNGWQHFNKVDYDENILNKYNLIKSDYFFSLGSLEPNKNIKWVIKMAKKRPNDIFIVAGSANREVFKTENIECPDNIKFIGRISDSEIKTLMRDCKAFLFPSFYEGFGIPPLEAMSAGTKKIVVSDISVMHEIFNNSVIYINPHEFKSIDIEKFNIDEKNIKVILNKFSWSKTAKKIWSVCENINNKIQ